MKDLPVDYYVRRVRDEAYECFKGLLNNGKSPEDAFNTLQRAMRDAEQRVHDSRNPTRSSR